MTGLCAGLGEPWFDTVEECWRTGFFRFRQSGAWSSATALRLPECAGVPPTIPTGSPRPGGRHGRQPRGSGIGGGITNGMPLVFRCAVKPTPSIALPQDSVDFVRGENVTLRVRGRHDPCVAPRACPVIDAVTALTVADLLLMRFGNDALRVRGGAYGAENNGVRLYRGASRTQLLGGDPRHAGEIRLQALRAEAGGGRGFYARPRLPGINVTIPYKRTVIPYLDSIDGSARAIGAVNTVLCRDGKLIGYNTDFLRDAPAARRAGIDVAGSGGGAGHRGTSSTACAVLRAEGAASVIRVAQTCRGGYRRVMPLYGRREDIGILLNTTRSGCSRTRIYPQTRRISPHLRGVADAVYHPLRTAFVCRARACGIPPPAGCICWLRRRRMRRHCFGSPGYAGQNR